MVDTAMLAPAAVLALWSLVVLLWMVVTRFSAFKTAKVDLRKSKPGGRGQDLEGVLPDRVNWKAHNYTHLMEQPTLFYAVVIIIALAGPSQTDIWLAWGYTALRVVHSLYQGLFNKVPVRLVIFTLATACLFTLAVRAVTITLA